MTFERDLNLVQLVRAIVQTAVAETQTRVRTSSVLSGAVEDLDDQLDVVFIRMDEETLGSDPFESDNYEFPGVIPTFRLGETFVGEQVRVDFDPRSGASAMRTSIESRIVLPFGAEEGQRIVIDGVQEGGGFIVFVNEADEIVGYLDPTQWFVGTPGGALARLDPLGGLRLRDENDQLRALLSASEGLTLRDAATGLSTLIARPDGLVILDPESGERISISSGNVSATPTPKWVSTSGEGAVGSSHSTPAITSFATGDDIDLRFTAVSAPSGLGTQSYTPPANYTERSDSNHSGSGLTLATSSATRDPALANPGVASFVNTSAGWTRRNGHSVIVRGGGATSPSFRSAAAGNTIISAADKIEFEISAPAGTSEGDILVAFVAITSPNIPIGWSVPDGWTQLGVQVAGLGTSHILGSGIWFKRAGPSEPASEPVAINMSAAAGTTKVQPTVVAVQNPYAFPAGLDIRRNNRSMPRGIEHLQILTTSQGPFSSGINSLDMVTPNLSLKAGRTYAITLNLPSVELDVLTAGARWRLDLLRNGTRIRTFGFIEYEFTGLHKIPVSSTQFYVPASDEVVTFLVTAAQSATGGVFFLRGAADLERSFTVVDMGATF